MNIKDTLHGLLDEARKLEEEVSDKLKTAPEGYLRLVYYRGAARYYLRKSPGDKGGEYLGKDKEALIRALEERDYLKKVKCVIEKRKEALLKVVTLLETMPSPDAVFYGIPDDRKHLINPVSATRCMDEDEIYKWDKLNENRNHSTPEKFFLTAKGEKVRSKSEVIIADRLLFAGVPYHYETQLNLSKGNFFHSYIWNPDFKVLNRRTGEEYYWEHFGMMGDPDYCAAALFKLETYAEFGLFPGRKLIISAESREHALNIEYVDRLISQYLL